MIQATINSYLAKKQEERKTRERSGLWNPSSLGGCYRKQWYNRKDIPPTNEADERTLRVFQAGNLFEQFVCDIIKEKIPEAQFQVEIFDETLRVKGFADIVLPDEVIELKSMHSKGFHYLYKSHDPIEVQKPHNVLQVFAGAVVLNKPKCRLAFLSKDDLCIQEYGFIMNDERVRIVLDEFTTLNKIWDKGELPPPSPRLFGVGKDGPRECSYCNWKDKCREDKRA